MDKKVIGLAVLALTAFIALFIIVNRINHVDVGNTVESKLLTIEQPAESEPHQNTATTSATKEKNHSPEDSMVSKENPVGVKLAIKAISDLENLDAIREEIIKLADTYPEDELIQFLAVSNCHKSTGCDYERFAKRLLEINPSNAMAKASLAAFSFSQGDDLTALEALEKINTSDEYPSYLGKISEAAYVEFEHSNIAMPHLEQEKFSKEVHLFSAAMGLSFATPLQFDTFKKCKEKTESSFQPKRWLSACERLGIAMENSDSSIDISLGLILQKHTKENKLSDQAAESALHEIEFKRDRINALLELNGEFLTPENPDFEKELSAYRNDLFKFGEMGALERLAQRHGLLNED